MRRGLALVAAAAAIVVLAGASQAAAAGATCSRAAARAVVTRYHLGNAGSVTDPVGQVLCGAFVGAGSRAMVASLTTPGCGGTIGWVVFRYKNRAWRIVMRRDEGAQLAAVGTSIRETQQVLRPGDPHCLPSGGTRSRTWRWNGTRFVTTPWKKRGPAATVNPPAFYARLSTVTVGCGVAAQQQLACQAFPKAPAAGAPTAEVAQLTPDGALTSCAQRSPTDACLVGDLGEGAPDLPVGQQSVIGPFTCAVLDTGVQCTVTDTGKGFMITATAVTPVGT
jgi:hypothetical protein